MGRPAGLPKTGGRTKGTPNKATAEFRQTVQALLDENRDNVGRWLSLVAEGDGTDSGKPDPAKALDLLAKLAEYAAPKLNRTEHTGDGGGPLQHSVKVTFE
jgi:phage-related minor tail protein